MKSLTIKTFLLLFVFSLIICGFNSCSLKDDKKKGETANDTSKNVQEREVESNAGDAYKVSQNSDESGAQKVNLEKSEVNTTPPGEIRKTFGRNILNILEKQDKKGHPANQGFKSGDISISLPGQDVNEDVIAKFDSLTETDEKISFLSELGPSQDGSVLKIVDKALNDREPQVRLAAIELLVDYNSPDMLPIVSKALKDKGEQVRKAAISALTSVNDPNVNDMLIQALSDKSEDVRMAVLEVAEEKEESTRLEVLRAGISSPYKDVKEDVVSSLIGLSNHDAVDILILGLKDSDSEFREDVKSVLELLISQEFSSYEEAKNWWTANKDKYDEDLTEKDE